MRLTFNPLARNLARLACCLTFALTASTGISVRGAIVASGAPDEQAELVRSLSPGLIIDWNSDCHVLPIAGLEDQQRADLPALTLEDLQANEPTPAAARAASPEAADTDASIDGDYLDYKYSRYSRYYGKRHDATPSTAESTGESSRADDPAGAGDPAGADDAATDGTDGAATTDEDSADSDDAAQADDPAADDGSNSDDQAEIPGDDGQSKEENSANGLADRGASDSDTSSSLEQYYKQHNVQLDENGDVVGTTPDTGNDDIDRSEDGKDAAAQASDAGASEDHGSAGETPSDDDCDRNPALARAMGDIVSNWAEETLAGYGLTTERVARLLGWNE